MLTPLYLLDRTLAKAFGRQEYCARTREEVASVLLMRSVLSLCSRCVTGSSVTSTRRWLTTTLITKLLTNPLAQSRSTADSDDQSPASGPVHFTGQLSMAWKRSMDSSRAGQEIQTAPPHW